MFPGDLLEEVFSDWIKMKGLQEIILANDVALPLVAKGPHAEPNECSLSAALCSIESVANSIKNLLNNSTVEYSMIKLRQKKVFIFRVNCPAQNMVVLYFATTLKLAQMKRMNRVIDLIVQIRL